MNILIKKIILPRSLVAIAIGLSLANAATATTPYFSITEIPTPGQAANGVLTINNGGQVTGVYSTVPFGPGYGFLYGNGVLTSFGQWNYATTINDNGAMTFSSNGVHYLNNQGVISAVGNPGDNIEFVDINNNETVIGTSWDITTGTTTSFVYKNGAMQTFGQPNDLVRAINDHGDILYFAAGGGTFIYRNNGGFSGKLGQLRVDDIVGSDINNNRHVVGQADFYKFDSVRNYDTRAFLYIPEENRIQNLGTLSGTNSSYARALNNQDQVIGHAYYNGADRRAFFYTDGQMYDLNSLIAWDSGWTLSEVYDINDLGQIVGIGLKDGQQRAFILTPDIAPVPLPSTVWLLGSGLVGMAGVARRLRAKPV